jgi:hypothetical protein
MPVPVMAFIDLLTRPASLMTRWRVAWSLRLSGRVDLEEAELGNGDRMSLLWYVLKADWGSWRQVCRGARRRANNVSGRAGGV